MAGVSESMLITSISSWFTPTVLFCVTNLIIATLFIASNNNNNKQHNDHSHNDSSSRMTRVSSFLSRTESFNLSSYATTSTTSELHHHYQSQSKPPSYSSSSRLAQSIHVPSSYITTHELSNTELEPQQPSKLVRTPSLLERVKSIKFSSIYTEQEQNTNSPSQLIRVPSFFDRVKSFKFTQQGNVDTNTGQHPEDHHVVRSKSEKTKVKKKSLVSEMKKSRSEIKIANDDDKDVYSRRPATTRERGKIVDEEVDAKADDFISRFKQQLKLQRLESLVRYNELLNRRS